MYINYLLKNCIIHITALWASNIIMLYALSDRTNSTLREKMRWEEERTKAALGFFPLQTSNQFLQVAQLKNKEIRHLNVKSVMFLGLACTLLKRVGRIAGQIEKGDVKVFKWTFIGLRDAPKDLSFCNPVVVA